MSIGLNSNIPPEIEAHLINDSDFIRKIDTVYLGALSITYDNLDRTDYYALYALPRSGSVSFGAHFGTDPWEYVSGEFMRDDKSMTEIAPSTPIATAMIRYLLLTR